MKFPKPSKGPSQRERRQEEQALYVNLVKPAYLAGLARGQKKLRPVCEACGRQEAVEIHHKRGRDGSALLDASYFMGVCLDCHRHLHHHPADAYNKGWLLRRNAKETT